VALMSECSIAHSVFRNNRIIWSSLALLFCSSATALASPPLLAALAPFPGVVARTHSGAPLILAQGLEDVTFRAYDLSGAPARPIPFRIESLDTADPGAQLFIFTGLPKGVKLNPGGNFGDFWAVNANVIKDLTLTAPPGFSGSFKVWITRSRTPSAAARSVAVTVTIRPRTSEAPTPPSLPTMPTVAATPKIPEPTETAAPQRTAPTAEQMLLTRASETFQKGDVSGARVVFEYLAMRGNAAAAIAMGETYDPKVLSRLLLKGLEPDQKKARQWYEKAEQLGSGEARNRLKALAAAK
jgi:hypothetical protein